MASSPTRQNVKLQHVRRCESQKYGFGSYEDALMGAERQMELGKVSPGCHLTPYECDHCGEWHIYNRRIVWVDRRSVAV